MKGTVKIQLSDFQSMEYCVKKHGEIRSELIKAISTIAVPIDCDGDSELFYSVNCEVLEAFILKMIRTEFYQELSQDLQPKVIFKNLEGKTQDSIPVDNQLCLFVVR